MNPTLRTLRVRSTLAPVLALLSIAALSVLAPMARADDGDPEPAFNGNGRQVIGWNGGLDDARPNAVAALADGALIVAGEVSHAGSNDDFAAIRLRANGALDLAWGESLGRTRVAIDLYAGGADEVRDLAVLSDGSLLLAGLADAVANAGSPLRVPALVKLDASGHRVGTFGTDGVVTVPLPWPTTDYYLSAVGHQPDGRTLFAGYCYNCPENGSEARPMVLRLTTSGAPDPTFSGDGWFVPAGPGLQSIYPLALGVDAAGRILVLAQSGLDFVLLRLTAGGDPDLSFGGGDGLVTWPTPPGVSSPYAFAIDLESGAMYVSFGFAAGAFQDYAGIVRLTAAGALDPAFADDGEAEVAFDERSSLSQLAVQSDGKLVGVGSVRTGTNDNFLLVRLLADGAFDPTFDGNGAQNVNFDLEPNGGDRARAMTFTGGKLVAVGSVNAAGSSRFGISESRNALIFASGFERGSTTAWGGH